MIQFTVPTIPIAQPRQRQRVVHSGGRAFASNYLPKSDPVNTFKAAVQAAFAQAHQGAPLAGPVFLSFVAVFPRTKGETWKTKPMPRKWHVKKPDSDNVEKAIKDALSGLAYLDDAQVCDTRARKLIASGDEQPHVLIRIDELTEAALTKIEEE